MEDGVGGRNLPGGLHGRNSWEEGSDGLLDARCSFSNNSPPSGKGRGGGMMEEGRRRKEGRRTNRGGRGGRTGEETATEGRGSCLMGRWQCSRRKEVPQEAD